MPEPKIIKFEPWHIGVIEAREWLPTKPGIEMLCWADYVAFSGECEGKLIGAGGVTRLISQKGYVWVILSQEIEHHRVWFHRQAKRLFREIITQIKVSEIVADIKEDSVRNRRWAEAMGFHVLEPQEKLTANGQTHLRYVYEVR